MTTAQHPSRTARSTADKRNNQQRKQDAKAFRELVGLLRHRTEVSQLLLRADGSVPVTTLLQLPDYSSFRLEDLQRMVKYQRDVRLEMLREGDKWFIRATRGHSMSHVETAAVSQRRITDPQEVTGCVHGTFWEHWPAIRRGGLSAMRRNCIHFGQDKVPHKGHEVHIYVDLGAAIDDGYAFYLTAGGYIVSPGRDGDGILPTKYFKKVVDASTNEPVPLECDPPPRPPSVQHETQAIHIHRVLPHLTGRRCTTLDDARTYSSVYYDQQYDTKHLHTSNCLYFYGHRGVNGHTRMRPQPCTRAHQHLPEPVRAPPLARRTFQRRLLAQTNAPHAVAWRRLHQHLGMRTCLRCQQVRKHLRVLLELVTQGVFDNGACARSPYGGVKALYLSP